MRQNLLSKIKENIQKNKCAAISDLCLEYLLSKNPEDEFTELYETLDYLVGQHLDLGEHLETLLEVIFEFFLEHQYYTQLKEFLRRYGNLIKLNPKQRAEVIKFYKSQYSEIDHLDEILHHSGIYETEKIGDAVKTLESLVRLKPLTPIRNSRFGYGEIIKIDWLLDCVVVDFFSGQIQHVPFSSAASVLEVLPPDHFFYLKIKSPQRLKELITENPKNFLSILTRDLEKHPSPSEIKELLTNVVSQETIEELIKFFKKNTLQNKTKLPETAKQKELEIDYNALFSYSPEEIIKLLKKSSKSQKEKIIKKLLEDPGRDSKKLLLDLFINSSDKQIWNAIFNIAPDECLMFIVEKVFNEYRQYPQHFFYLVDKEAIADKLEILLRYLDLAGQKKLVSEIRKRIIANNYQLLYSVIEKLDSTSAVKILERINELPNFYPEERDYINKLFAQKFGSLYEEKEDYIYHTERAIKLKKEELQRLKHEELPKVASEVARARSYGDLRENFEYKAAKEKQKRLFNLILQIENELKKAQPIDFNQIDTTKVSLGTRVTLIDEFGGSVNYTILGPWDSDLASGIISYLAPFAQRLLGKTVGEEIFDLEGKRYKITAITKPNLSD
ncbi:MAG: GreA/GreB family elongation factor [candidate division WOR-3 bacterium]|nr:GreA/GreB family elongation factor [candidate division WOR-3 bacterium]MCX7757690.1 GreA/GreB family elongation factor [candidate division WOR-3 bacterium]MDW7987426.1 GreA/GreB family elongation factor [candidate division WOR-3 bacterium]